MTKVLLAAAAALVLSACSNMGCDLAGNDRSGAGSCGLHTTFLASAAAAKHPHALGKS